MEYVIGFIAFPVLCFLLGLAVLLWHAAKWGWHDMMLGFEAGLKPGRSKWNWVWILPKLFFVNSKEELLNRLNGDTRVG